MAKFKGKYRIEPNRALFWDYSSAGDYFITVCIHNREPKLGYIANSNMILSNYGIIVESELQKIEYYHKRIKVNTWVIMPNHIHIIISIENTDYDNGISQISDIVDFGFAVDEIHEFHLQQNQNQQPSIQPDDAIKQYRKRRRNMLIPKILGKFKQQTSKQMNILQNTAGSKNWQRDYHDHIIRNKSEYYIIQNYIINNPKNWVEDTFYFERDKEVLFRSKDN